MIYYSFSTFTQKHPSRKEEEEEEESASYFGLCPN
jgi:hypothetical protein